MNFDKDLDARGLNCPLPILRAKKALTEMQGGQAPRIVSTDVRSIKDFQAFCTQTGDELLSQSEASNGCTFFLKRKWARLPGPRAYGGKNGLSLAAVLLC